jgi:hypothetical protein
MVIPAILAAVANAIFIYQILEPTSFPSAILGTEIRAVPRATWEEMYQELRSRLTTDPVARRNESVNWLIRALAKAEPGPLVLSTKNEAPIMARADPENLLCRLASATLLDFEAGAALSPSERFESFRRIVEATPTANSSRLYNKEFTQAWHEVLKKHIGRADVAAAVAIGGTVDHYAALPKMQRRLSQLASDLRAQGHETEADSITRWLGQSLFGLIDSETGAGTRLLCAELIQKTEPESRAALDLAKLRDAYHAHASAASVDLTHPDRAPVVLPELFNRVWATLIAAGTIVTTSFGALLVFFFSLLCKFMPSQLRDSVSPSCPSPTAALRSALIGIAFPALIAIVSARITANGLFAGTWGALLGFAILAWGELMVPIVWESDQDSRTYSRSVRLGIVILLMLALLVLAASPPGPFVMYLQPFDKVAIIASLAIAAIVLAAVVAFFLLPRARQSVVRIASITWMASALAALVILQFHQIQDNWWVQHAAVARLDEFPARLGPDWQEKYLKSARAAYAMPLAERDIPRP